MSHISTCLIYNIDSQSQQKFYWPVPLLSFLQNEFLDSITLNPEAVTHTCKNNYACRCNLLHALTQPMLLIKVLMWLSLHAFDVHKFLMHLLIETKIAAYYTCLQFVCFLILSFASLIAMFYTQSLISIINESSAYFVHVVYAGSLVVS